MFGLRWKLRINSIGRINGRISFEFAFIPSKQQINWKEPNRQKNFIDGVARGKHRNHSVKLHFINIHGSVRCCLHPYMYNIVQYQLIKGDARSTHQRRNTSNTHTLSCTLAEQRHDRISKLTHTLTMVSVARWRDKLVKMIFMFAHFQSPLWLSLWDDFILFNRTDTILSSYGAHSHSIKTDWP